MIDKKKLQTLKMILKFLDKYLEKMLKPESFANNLGISMYIFLQFN